MYKPSLLTYLTSAAEDIVYTRQVLFSIVVENRLTAW